MTVSENPLLHRSELPYELPDYCAIVPEHYLPAFRQGFAQQRDEIEHITSSAEPPTFENTMEPLERSGALLERVSETFYTVSSADASPEIQAIDEEITPEMTAHHDALVMNSHLYSRVSALAEQLDSLTLTPEQQRLVQRWHREMTLAGAASNDADKETLTQLNQRIASLSIQFEKNLLADTNDLAVVFHDASELDGLSAGDLSAAARTGAERGLSGSYVLTLPLFTGHPALESLTNRESRRRIMAASLARGARGNENDNRNLVAEITALRAERARLLGYSSHAAAVIADETAGSPEVAQKMLRDLAVPAARNVAAEGDVLQQLIDQTESEPFALEAHDWAYYTQKVRKERYDIDTTALLPWFEAERVLHDGVFFAANRLYGVTFTKRTDLTAYHPDTRVFEVANEDGSPLGLYVLDLYTRDSKRGGAWMNSMVNQSSLRGTSAVAINSLNVPKPGDGNPTFLTLDETSTLFHEFGHALHGLFSNVTYPHFSGTNVPRDFVEFPSQVNEMWMLWPEVLDSYARHYETGAPLPADVVERLREAEAFNQGFATSEYLAAAWLDHVLHSLPAGERFDDIGATEAAALAEVGLNNPTVPPRYSAPYFAHCFSGGYSAGYYSYIWSEVLDADTVEWFRENGGLTRQNGERFRERLLSVGGSQDPLEAYRHFRGRDAEIRPLLERRGLNQ